jgi:hypothetical protein
MNKHSTYNSKIKKPITLEKNNSRQKIPTVKQHALTPLLKENFV